MTTLVLLFVTCALAAITLGLYSAVLFRKRARPAVAAAAPAPEAPRPQAPAPRAARGLPGMPPPREQVPSGWSAVDRKLESRAARGSIAPPPKLAGNRFNDVLTAGLPVVAQPPQPPSRSYSEDDWADD